MRSSQTFTSASCPSALLKKLDVVSFARVLTLLAMITAIVWPANLRAQNAMEREYEIKAAYLYNFINYIEWPSDSLPQAGGTITVGIIGESPYSSAFDAL